VDTVGFRGDHHWMDQDGPAIPAGEKLHIVERFRMVNDGRQLEIDYTMTDPDNWEGEGNAIIVCMWPAVPIGAVKCGIMPTLRVSRCP